MIPCPRISYGKQSLAHLSNKRLQYHVKHHLEPLLGSLSDSIIWCVRVEIPFNYLWYRLVAHYSKVSLHQRYIKLPIIYKFNIFTYCSREISFNTSCLKGNITPLWVIIIANGNYVLVMPILYRKSNILVWLIYVKINLSLYIFYSSTIFS